MRLTLVLLAIFFISIDPVYSGSSARRSIVSSELRGIWILPSP